MTGRNSSDALTPLQLAILDFVWSNGPSTAEQIREALRPRHPLKDSSIRTLLRRLEARGLLTHGVEGKAFVYEAKVPSRQLAAAAIRRVIQRFYAGSVEQLVVGMVDEKVLSAPELERLARKVRTRK